MSVIVFIYSSLHHPACSQQRAQYGQKQRRQNERAGGNQQLDRCALDLALDCGAMGRADLATLSSQRLGQRAPRASACPTVMAKVSSALTSKSRAAANSSASRVPTPTCHAMQARSRRTASTDRRLAQKISSAASNERPAEKAPGAPRRSSRTPHRATPAPGRPPQSRPSFARSGHQSPSSPQQ